MRAAKIQVKQGDAPDFRRAKALVRSFTRIFDDPSFVAFLKRVSSKSKAVVIQSKLATLLTLMDSASPAVQKQVTTVKKHLIDLRKALEAKTNLTTLNTHVDKLAAAVDAAKTQPKTNKAKSFATLEQTYDSLKADCESTAPLSSDTASTILTHFEAFVDANERFWREAGAIKRAWKGPLAKTRDAAESAVHELLTSLIVTRKLDALLATLESPAATPDHPPEAIFSKRAPVNGTLVTIYGVRQEHAGADFIAMVNERARRYAHAVDVTSALPSPWGELMRLEIENDMLSATAGLTVADIEEMKRINDAHMREIRELRTKNTRAEKQLLC